MRTIKVFLASSGTLQKERIEIERWLARKNDSLVVRNLYLELNIWEKVSASFTERRKQDEFNDYVIKSDMFICLVHDKVGQFTSEEFEKAYESFVNRQNPKRLLVYFKNIPITPSSLTSSFQTVLELKQRIRDLQQIWSEYSNVKELILYIDREVDSYLSSFKETTHVYPYELVSMHSILDFQDDLGHLVQFELRSHIRALKDTQTVFDSLSVDGNTDQDSIVVYPGSVAEMKKEDNRLEIQTQLNTPLTFGDEIIKILNCDFIDSFINSEEYWIEEQVNPCNILKTTIIFPPGRPPQSWSAKRLRAWNELDCVQPVQYVVRGRVRLDFETRYEKIHDRYRIDWKW